MNRPNFEQRLSSVNRYGRSLLHLAVHLRYRELVQRLVDWGIDLNLKDMNGFTALHAAYLCGDLSITHTLEQLGGIQLSLDILGRPPIELASGATPAPEERNQVSHVGNHFNHRPFVCSGVW
jgi:ankyrin repeat protein